MSIQPSVSVSGSSGSVSGIHPSTPLSAQLERLLTNVTSIGGQGQASHAPNNMDSPDQSVKNSPRTSVIDSSGSDPMAALDNLFAAKFSFQFDNLQHILRYVLGELRNQKRVSVDFEKLNQRLSTVESARDISDLIQQATQCRKHNTQASINISRLEERVIKEGALYNRRLGGLEVSTDRLDQALGAHAAQIDALTAHINSASKSGGSVVPLSTLSSPAIAGGGMGIGAARRDAIELEGMAAQISKFMVSSQTTEVMLRDKIIALEDAEAKHIRLQADSDSKISFLQNEQKRLSEKLSQMEEFFDQLKMNPSSINRPRTATTEVTAVTHSQPKQPVVVSSVHPSSHKSTASLPLPKSLGGSDSAASIDLAVDEEAAKKNLAHQLAAAQQPTDQLSEAHIALVQERIESTVSRRIAILRSELDDRWSVEKEGARDHRHQVMNAVQQASEAALDAKSALEQAKKVATEAAKTAVNLTHAALLEDAQATAAAMAAATPADLMERGMQVSGGFAGLEQVAGAAMAATARPMSPQQSARSTVSAGGGMQPIQPHPQAIPTGKAQAPKLLNATQNEFDRVRAMAELALRRTVQHSEQIQLMDARDAEAAGLGASAQAAELEKLRTSSQNLSARVLHTEDKLETLNALTLATRNALQALGGQVENNPQLKSISLRVFESELKFGEMADKVALLAHLISKGKAVAVPPGSAQSQQGGLVAGSAGAVPRIPSTAVPRAPVDPLAVTRSLVSALASDDAASSAATSHHRVPSAGLGPTHPPPGHPLARQVAGDDSEEEEELPLRNATTTATKASALSNQRNAELIEDDTSKFTDEVDTNAVALGMVLRSGPAGAVAPTTAPTIAASVGAPPGTAGASAAASEASERMAKDMRLLGTLQEKLASAAALDAKLAQVDALEAKVAALIDLDLKERLTFIERRFTTELTFLRSHVNTKVDSSSLKILLDKVELEASHSAAALQIVQQSVGSVGVGSSSSVATHSPTKQRGVSALGHRADSTEDGDASAHVSSSSGVGTTPMGSMGRATSRDNSTRVGVELEARARDRKMRMAHLLAMLEKKADTAAIKQLEEFVRSVDRHLRSMMQSQASQLRQLEAYGVRIVSSVGTARPTSQYKPGGKIATVPGYDEPEPAVLSSSAHNAANSRIAAAQSGYEDLDPDDEAADYALETDDATGAVIPQRRRARPIQFTAPRHTLSDNEPRHADESVEREAANRVGISFTPAGSSSLSGLHVQCEQLQNQIAALHAALARKVDKPLDGSTIEYSTSSIGSNNVPTVGGVALTLDGLTLNPNLSLLSHPHIARLVTGAAESQTNLEHLQGLVMYQSKQLRNHREWIAKHSREINAIREFVQAHQSTAVRNASAVGDNATSSVPQPLATVAASSAYPSPSVFTLLRQVESDIVTLRRALKHKVDYTDLGILSQEQQQQQPTGGNAYPHPTLEDLRRLLFYLTPQLQNATGGNRDGGGGGGLAALASAQEGKGGSLITTKGNSQLPHIVGLEHTHGPGHPDTCQFTFKHTQHVMKLDIR
jgi:hypothetical protein